MESSKKEVIINLTKEQISKLENAIGKKLQSDKLKLKVDELASRIAPWFP